MHITQVSHLYRPSIGGIENYVHRLRNSLSERGHGQSIITTTQSLANDQSPLNREENVTYCTTTATVLRNPFSLELYREVQKNVADLYHLHSPWYLSTLAAVHALPKWTPMVITVHGFQPINTIAARILDVAYKPFAGYIFSRVNRVIALGESEKQRLIGEFDLPPTKIAVIPNGIHPREHDVPPSTIDTIHEKYDIDPETPTVLYVSRLVPLKNPGLLIDAVSNHLSDLAMDVLLVGNGDPSYVDDLKGRADDCIRFLSNLPFEDLQAVYHAADLFVLPSRSEGLPTVVLEAMNARLPILTTPVGALADVISHREHGWLLAPQPDEREIARAIRYYLEHPDERQEVGERNRAYVRSEFDWDDVAADITAVYEDVLGRM